MFWVLGIVWISASREMYKKHFNLECSVFSSLSCTIENHFSHVLGTILLMWRLIKSFCFCSHFHTSVYLKLLTKEINLFCFWARPSISILGPFIIEVWKYIQYRRVGSVSYGSASNCIIPMNITIRIRLKIDPSGFQQKCISGDFPQLLELPLLRTHIDGCFQSVREAAS